MIRTVVAQLEKSGHVTRGYIGVEAQQVTPTTAKAMHLKENVRCAARRRAAGQPGCASRSATG